MKKFLRKYIFATDHKIIGLQFLFTALIFMFFGGLLAMAIRWQLAWPGEKLPILGIMMPETYDVIFTMHGTFMIFFVVIAILVGAFGNFLIPLMVGTHDMAFPKINMASYWLFFISCVIMVGSFFAPGGAAATGWTAYAPVSVIASKGQTWWLVSLIFLGTSSILGSFNYLTTIINLRAPGMGFFRMPMSVWGLFITAILSLLATPVLTSALAMLLLDRLLGTTFFLGGVGQPVLWQHVFWFYSHPAVYIMILPAMGMASDILSVFSRKPLFGYHAMVYALSAIAGLGFIVWAHHMFATGINPTLGTTFMVSTMLIAVPTGVKIFNWLGTLFGGRIRLTTPMLMAIAFVSMFVIGGLSGIFLAATAVDIFLHDTYFVVAHIHYVLFGGSMFGIFAGLYFWYPKMFGRMMNEKLGKIHFWFTFVFYNFTFFPMHLLGIHGMPRRIYDYRQYGFLQGLEPLQIFISISAFALFLGQIPFVYNFFVSLFRGKKAGNNPWQANTLEWTISSPAPHLNYEVIPKVYHGPYEYSVPGKKEDWTPQNQP
ncbi:MAG: cbb3-type cytochrome c oxidase subunit I [Chlamydiae bacterium]|nr:cbb3-type cytochrome c oxidase subunit I [Chlamydiota bacterium]MBI3277246.1 cbb3-type cytochrome c oxidase subunit I [Chlamydiota bacterium]